MTRDQNKDVVLYAVGDVFVDRPRPSEAFELITPVFKAADIVFGNNESVYSERGARSAAAPGAHRAHPRNATALGPAGFTVMSCANNHTPDFGPDALADTLDALRSQGILTAGAGPTLSDARSPAVMHVGETRVAVLAYASVFPPGYDATSARAGIAPLRAHTLYEHVDVGQPGTTPEIHTFPYRRDAESLREDVARARDRADIVIVSAHWGIHLFPASIADYERDFARAAIDAGADLVLGHHQHIVKGIDTYRGKVIFHGLGNFVGDLPDVHDVISGEAFEFFRKKYGDYAVVPRDGYPTYPFHPDSRMTIVAGCVIRHGEIVEVGFLPCMINQQGQPGPQGRTHPGWMQVVAHVERSTREAGLNATFGQARSLGEPWVALEV